MTLAASIEDHIARLVHPTAYTADGLAAAHKAFIETRLAAGFGALAVVPVFLVGGSIPGLADVLILAWLVVPFVAVALVSTWGRLREAELVSAGAWAGLAATLVLSGSASAATGAMLLLLMPLEASLGGGKWLSGTAAVAIGGAAVLLLLADAHPVVAEPLFLLLGMAYAVLLCARASSLSRARDAAQRQDREHHRALFEAIGDLAIRFDDTGAAVINGHRAQDTLSLEARDLAGRGFFERVHLADRPLFMKLISDGSRHAGEREGVLRVRVGSRPGTTQPSEEPVFRTINMRVRPLPGMSANGPGALATVRVALSDDINAPRTVSPPETAPAPEIWSDRFMATISHESRTPLNAIIGFSEMLASETYARQAGTREEYAGIIRSSGQHLLSVVNSLLDLSKMGAGKFELVREPFPAADMLASCCDMVRLKAEQARVDVVWTVDPPDLQIVADQRACRQIVLNLLTNAVKFTPEYGQARVEVRRDGETFVLAVTDTGIGILAPDLAHLGDPFFQAQGSERRFDGSGLGLSVVSGLVGLHGGTIQAESAPGEGTRVTIRLPVGGRGERHAGAAKIEAVNRRPRAAAAPGPAFDKVKRIA